MAACQEERASRIKHDWHFPAESINYCMKEAGISSDQLACVVFHEKPLLKFERVLETFLSTAPLGYRAFVDSIPSWLKQKLQLPRIISKHMTPAPKLLYSGHHLSHAASAYFASPFDRAAILTIDGVGEWATASYGHAEGTRLETTNEMRFPHSLGLLYSAVTAFLGFRANHDEYKIMGMAPYGRPAYKDIFEKKLAQVMKDGSIRLNMDHFTFQYGRSMIDPSGFLRLFGIPVRRSDDDISDVHYDIAASLQDFTETVVLKMAENVHTRTGMKNLCLSGGVALNCVANSRLLREGPFDDIFVQPAAGDAGAALGAAYAANYLHFGEKERTPLESLYLGPSYRNEEISDLLRRMKINFSMHDDEALIERTAGLLAEKKVVGWFQGRMEFGPRALGNRSILADTRSPEMKDIVNSKIKFRESFRPFAPVVTEEDASSYFSIDRPSPYMLFTKPVISRDIPAITHVDGSARVQTLSQNANPRLYLLLRQYEKLTNLPVLMNTSLNIKSEPIAMTPSDAVNCFNDSKLDALVLENCLILK